MTLTPPLAAFPESALRAVLAGCVDAWARSASAPPAEGGGDTPRLLYVDAFAGAELQFGTGVARSGDEETRAAAAIRALAEADGAATVHAVFVEEDPAHLQRIYADLERVAGGERLRATRDLAALDPGEATLVEADFRHPAPEIARFAIGARALLLVAPPAARRQPWEVLRPFVTAPNADVLIRVPHADFEKQSRHTGTLADLPGFARTIVEGASAMLDDAKHAWLPAWRAAAKGGIAAAMDDVLGRFHRLLESAAPNRIVKPATLQSGGATTYLFLVTSDPALALAFESAAGAPVRAAKPTAPAKAASKSEAAPSAKEAKAAKTKGGRSAKAAKPIAEPSTPAESPSPAADPTPIDAAADLPLPEAPPAESPSPPADPPPIDAEADLQLPESPSPAADPIPISAEADPPLPEAPPADENPPESKLIDPAPANVNPAPSPEAAPVDANQPEPKPIAPAPVDVNPPPSPEAAPAEANPPAPKPKPSRSTPAPKPSAPAPAPSLMLDLFPESLPEPDPPAGADIDALAESLAARHAGLTVAWGDLLRDLADGGATPEDAKRVLAVLKRRGRAAYRSLKDDADEVDFPRDPIAPAPAAPRKRKRATEDGGFFGEDE